MEPIEHWRIRTNLTVPEATLLILNIAPDENLSDQPIGYVPVSTALQHAIISNQLNAFIGIDGPPLSMIRTSLEPLTSTDWTSVFVKVNELKEWLQLRRVESSFFLSTLPLDFLPKSCSVAEGTPTTSNAPELEHLDRTCPEYSPKLAAAVAAWKAVRTMPAAKRSKGSVKSHLIKWLENHANEFFLLNRDGHPINQAIVEIAKVANWDPKGGAPKNGCKNLPTYSKHPTHK